MKFQVLVAAVACICLIVPVDSSCLYHARLKRGAKTKNPHVVAKRSVTCDSSDRYRSYDGTCNNLNNALWGSVNQPFQRLLTAQYEDDDERPKNTGTGNNTLATPREISNAVHFELNFASNKYSTFVMQWGQFIDHDITKTPNVLDNDAEIDCCSQSDDVFSNASSPCFHMDLTGDAFFGDRCMNFVRSDPVTVNGVREQYNALTSFIDASMVYGVSEAEKEALRDQTSTHLLLVNTVNGDDFLPEGDSSSCYLNASRPDDYCFEAGDVRVNVFHGLSALHTLFVREHNRIATEFKSITSWTNDKIFEETRRIIAGTLQVITYNDWLPLIIGSDAINTYKLGKLQYVYNDTVNPTLANSFSAAAFRFGHSQVPNNITYDGELVDTTLFFKRTKYVLDDMDKVLTGIADTPSQRADAWYVDAMRNTMFATAVDAKDGFDMVSLNIQRGRDHGLPSYNDWRTYCGLQTIAVYKNVTGNPTDFGNVQANDFKDLFDSKNLTPDDIDLYSGGIAEIPLGQADVGPLFKCLIGGQFQRLRDGDRFWYRSTDTNVMFTARQIKQLERRTLAKVICDNTNVTEIQKNVFKQFSSSNSNVQCADVRGDLTLSRFT